MHTQIAAAALVLALSTPALAAEYYIVQSPTTHRCSVVSERPRNNGTLIIGGTSYTEQSDAVESMHTLQVCREAGTDGVRLPHKLLKEEEDKD